MRYRVTVTLAGIAPNGRGFKTKRTFTRAEAKQALKLAQEFADALELVGYTFSTRTTVGRFVR